MNDKSSGQIERDVEQTRARMTETLDELRARMSPGQIIDEVLSYARDSGGGKMMSNLGRSVQENPAPLLVIGAGIAWMMATSGSSRADGSWNDNSFSNSTADTLSDGVASVAQSARAAGERVSEGVASVAAAALGGAGELSDSAKRSIHDISDIAHRTGGSAYKSTRELGGTMSGILKEQPFVLGALGMAIGAALGAALPETDAEDRVMGEASDALREQVGSIASQGYEEAKAVAQATFHRVADAAHPTGEMQAHEAAVDDSSDIDGTLKSAEIDGGRPSDEQPAL